MHPVVVGTCPDCWANLLVKQFYCGSSKRVWVECEHYRSGCLYSREPDLDEENILLSAEEADRSEAFEAFERLEVEA